jgi:hypothetical protein
MFSSVANHLDKAYFTSSTIQALLDHYRTRDPRFFKLIHKVQFVFNALNIGNIVWGAKQIIDCIDKNQIVRRFLIDNLELLELDIKIPPLLNIKIPVLLTVATIFLWTIAAKTAVSHINKDFNPKEQLEKWNQNLKDVPSWIKVEKDTSPMQNLLQGLYVSQLVVSIVATCFSSMPLFFAANAVCHLYSLIQVSTWKSIRFDFMFSGTSTDRLNGIQFYKFSYFCSIFPSTKTEATICAICQEKKEEKPTSQFCAEHAFHDDCLIRMIYTKSQTFSNSEPAGIPNPTNTGTLKDFSYEMRVPQENFPRCPSCHKQPPQNELQVVVEELVKGLKKYSPAKVVIIPALQPR